MSGTEEQRRHVARWLRFAQADLEAGTQLDAHASGAPWIPCFHAQQAAEKALKALIVSRGSEPPKTHDLTALARALGGWALQEPRPDLDDLSVWATFPRYPGDWPEATGADAVRALTTARQVVRSVAEELARSGYETDDANP